MSSSLLMYVNGIPHAFSRKPRIPSFFSVVSYAIYHIHNMQRGRSFLLGGGSFIVRRRRGICCISREVMMYVSYLVQLVVLKETTHELIQGLGTISTRPILLP